MNTVHSLSNLCCSSVSNHCSQWGATAVHYAHAFPMARSIFPAKSSTLNAEDEEESNRVLPPFAPLLSAATPATAPGVNRAAACTSRSLPHQPEQTVSAADRDSFSRWKLQHGKRYGTAAEEARRRANFAAFRRRYPDEDDDDELPNSLADLSQVHIRIPVVDSLSNSRLFTLQ